MASTLSELTKGRYRSRSDRSRMANAVERAVVVSAWLTLALTMFGTDPAAASADSSNFPREISLPDGFQPEGIETGRGTSFYAGSLVDGSIYRGDLRSGQGRVLVPGADGGTAFGIELDRYNRLFVAGGFGGGARVYDAETGAELAAYEFAGAGSSLIHDVVVTSRAAYFTDSSEPLLHMVPIDRRGRLGSQEEVQAIPLSGDVVYQAEGPGCDAAPELNLTGIETTPGGHRLIAGQLNTGLLFSIDPATGVTETLDVGGEILECANGMVRRGTTLYVAQPPSHQVAVIGLGRGRESATLEREITGPSLDYPTAAAIFGRFLYTANARFEVEPTPETEYRVIRLPAAP